ncbi:MAG: sporulation protein YqfD, partial [Eubacterium sp.]
MLIKIINLLLGFVDFTFSGGFADGFINDCYNQKINVKNIVRRGDNIEASCGAAAYKRLHSAAVKN